MSEFKAVSLDGEVTLTSPNGKFNFPSHRKHEVRTYKITYVDDVGNTGFTYYAQSPFVGTDISFNANIISRRSIGHLPAIFTYTLGPNQQTRETELQPGAILNVKIGNLSGTDIVPEDMKSLFWVTDKNGNRVGGDTQILTYQDMWDYSTHINGATIRMDGLTSMPYENYTEEQKNNATYTLHVKETPTRTYMYNFLLVDGNDYFKCFEASQSEPCSYEHPCCAEKEGYSIYITSYVEVSCQDPREEGGYRNVGVYGGDYGTNCVIVAPNNVTPKSEISSVIIYGILMTPVGTSIPYIQPSNYTHDDAMYFQYRRSYPTFGVYKSDRKGNIIDSNPIYTWAQDFYISDECQSGYCTNYDTRFEYLGPGYISGGDDAFRNAVKNNFGTNNEYYFVISTVGITPSTKSLPIKAIKVNPCEGYNTSTTDHYKYTLNVGDKVRALQQPGFRPDVYKYESIANGRVSLVSGSTGINVAYYDFIGVYGYAIFDDDGSGQQAQGTDMNGRVFNVGADVIYMNERYIVTRIQSNGTITICQEEIYRNSDHPTMIETTGDKIQYR